MPSRETYSRRTIAGAGLGGVGALLTGGYAWNQYSRRHYLRLRYLRARNESDEPTELSVTVDSERDAPREETIRLEATGREGDETHVAGRWIKHTREWAVRARFEGRALSLSNREINERIDSGWGVDDAEITLLVTESRDLEAEIRPQV
ncbi:hypothetical protein [Natrononativus amylolyticus]|uniref:hypothetical protein n=1 Tax=Natrononativus amylolyticus TaxID=2963434 RepID=UPI0020CB7994|nr:hypothetical protein [Natrononativus amylolyticus]